MVYLSFILFFFSSRRRHTRCSRDWSSDVCSSDLGDVDFSALAERFALSGGDIKNAVIKAAAAAAADAGPEVGRRIHQRHFERAVEEVMAAKTVMQQSLFESKAP